MKKNIIAVTFLVLGVFTNAQTGKDIKVAELLETMGCTKAMKTSYEYMIEYYKKVIRIFLLNTGKMQLN